MQIKGISLSTEKLPERIPATAKIKCACYAEDFNICFL